MEGASDREYRLAPELRRCCWYVIFGAAGIGLLSFWIAPLIPNRDPPNVGAGIATVATIMAAAAVPLRWKLRIDADGISRRLFFGWSFWSWTDVASGRVSKLHPYTLHDPARPWWNRKLRLGYLHSDDIHEVLSVINTRYRLPPAPDLPERLTIKYGFRGSATFGDYGIQIIDRGTPYDYAWREVRGIQITRMDPLRRDFSSLQITLCDRELELKLVSHQGGTSPTWRGATSEVINQYLLRKVTSDRIDVSIAGRPPSGRKQIERKLNAAKTAVRNVKIMFAIFVPLILGCLVWMAVVDSVVKAIAMGVLAIVYPGLVMIYVYRQQTANVSELIELLNSAS